MNKQNTLFFSASLIILFAAFTRLLPHYPNFTAIGAMAIFGGSVIKDKKLAFLLPLGALILSDVCLQLFTSVPGFYGAGQFLVYGAFMIITLLATLIRKPSVSNVVFAAFWSGVIFFLISNLGVWALGSMYPKNASGLIACYAAAIPFYKNEFFGNFLLNSIYGNLFYASILFGAYALINRMVKATPAMAK